MGVTNAVAIDADTMELTLIGPGAGGEATASSVVADLIDLAAGRRVPSFGRPAAALASPQRAPMQRHEGGYYIRLAAVDRPGTAAAIATPHGGAEYLAGIHHAAPPRRKPHGGEDPRSVDKPAPVVLITYATTEEAVRRALAAMENDGVLPKSRN